MAAIAASDSAGRSLAAQFSRTCEGRLPPGMAQVTASCIRIQRSANCAMLTPAGSKRRISSTASRPVSKSTPEKVSPHVEGLAVTVEPAVIVADELGIAREFAAQHAAGQRNPRQNAHLPALRLLEE